MRVADLIRNLKLSGLSTAVEILACSFLLFTSSVIAQETNVKVVWSNLHKNYASFEDIKPEVKLEAGEFIFYKLAPIYDLLYRFDEKKKQWVEGKYAVVDYFGSPRTSLVLRRREKTSGGFTATQFFECEKSGGCFFVSHNRMRFPIGGKYRITFFYGIDPANPEKLDQFSHSPEFTIGAAEPAEN